MKPGDTYLVEGMVMMVVYHEDVNKYILVRLVGSTVYGRYQYLYGMKDFLKGYTKLSSGETV